LGPSKVVALRDNQSTGAKFSSDNSRGMKLQSSFDDQLADHLALHHSVANVRLGVEQVSLFLDHELPMSTETLRDGTGNPIIREVYIAAAPLAHRGGGGPSHAQLGATLETLDQARIDRERLHLRGRPRRFLDLEVELTLFADGGICGRRLELRISAPRARHRDFFNRNFWRGSHRTARRSASGTETNYT